jgi:hypothetical protein
MGNKDSGRTDNIAVTNAFTRATTGRMPETPPNANGGAAAKAEPKVETVEVEEHEVEETEEEVEEESFEDPREAAGVQDDLDDLFDTIIEPSNRTGTLKAGGYQRVRDKVRTVKLSFTVRWETMELLRTAQYNLPPHITRNQVVDKILREGLHEFLLRQKKRAQYGALRVVKKANGAKT